MTMMMNINLTTNGRRSTRWLLLLLLLSSCCYDNSKKKNEETIIVRWQSFSSLSGARGASVSAVVSAAAAAAARVVVPSPRLGRRHHRRRRLQGSDDYYTDEKEGDEYVHEEWKRDDNHYKKYPPPPQVEGGTFNPNEDYESPATALVNIVNRLHFTLFLQLPSEEQSSGHELVRVLARVLDEQAHHLRVFPWRPQDNPDFFIPPPDSSSGGAASGQQRLYKASSSSSSNSSVINESDEDDSDGDSADDEPNGISRTPAASSSMPRLPTVNDNDDDDNNEEEEEDSTGRRKRQRFLQAAQTGQQPQSSLSSSSSSSSDDDINPSGQQPSSSSSSSSSSSDDDINGDSGDTNSNKNITFILTFEDVDPVHRQNCTDYAVWELHHTLDAWEGQEPHRYVQDDLQVQQLQADVLQLLADHLEQIGQDLKHSKNMPDDEEFVAVFVEDPVLSGPLQDCAPVNLQTAPTAAPLHDGPDDDGDDDDDDDEDHEDHEDDDHHDDDDDDDDNDDNNKTTSAQPTIDDNWPHDDTTQPLDAGEWDVRRYAGLVVFLWTVCGTVWMTQWSAWRQRRQDTYQTWGNLASEDGVNELLRMGWKLDGTQMQVFDKAGWGYRDDDSIFMGGYEPNVVVGKEIAVTTTDTVTTPAS